MRADPANAPQFSFTTPAFPDEAVHVVRFSGTERLSGLFAFDLHLALEESETDAFSLLNKPASLWMDREGRAHPIHGIVTECEQKGRVGDYVSLRCTLRPRIWRLSLTRQSRIFQHASAIEIVIEVLNRNSFTTQDVSVDVKGTVPTRTYCVQYQESDLDFMQRLLEFEGIAYHFDHASGTDVLVLTDDRSARSSIDGPDALRFAHGAGMVHDRSEHVESFSCRHRMTSGHVVLRNHHDALPHTELQSGETVDARMPGEWYEHGVKHDSADDGARIARIRAQEVACRHLQFSGRSNGVTLRAGRTFGLKDHPKNDFNAEYLVTRVRHSGSQQEALGLAGADPGPPIHSELEGRPEDKNPGKGLSSTYANEFTCIPAEVSFRPKRETPVPVVPGILTAEVESDGGKYAFIDEEGRYRVKLRFDREATGDGMATKPIRLAQPTSGAAHGMHFPCHAGAEMVLACVNGDIDRPVALGAVPNPSQQSPSVAANRMQNVLRTFAGNELVMDDTTDQARVQLRSASGFELDLDDAEKRVRLTTPEQRTIILDDADRSVVIQTPTGRRLRLDDEAEDIQLQSARGHALRISDADDRIMITDSHGAHRWTLDFQNGTMSLKTEGDIVFEAEGTIEMSGASIRIDSDGDVEVSAGGAVQQTAEEDIQLSAKGDGSFTADRDLSVESGAEMQVKGMDVSIAGRQLVEAVSDRRLSLQGQNVEVEGAAVADIKAALLKLNG